MSSLDKCKQYDELAKRIEQFKETGDLVEVAVGAPTSDTHVRVTPTIGRTGSAHITLAVYLARVIKDRHHELIEAALAECKREAIDQAENVQRSAASALERLKGLDTKRPPGGQNWPVAP